MPSFSTNIPGLGEAMVALNDRLLVVEGRAAARNLLFMKIGTHLKGGGIIDHTAWEGIVDEISAIVTAYRAKQDDPSTIKHWTSALEALDDAKGWSKRGGPFIPTVIPGGKGDGES